MQNIEQSTLKKSRQRMAAPDRRAMILIAARQLFFSRGWDEVTITDVLQEAGISKGGFYHHFAAKEDLLDGIIADFTAEAMDSAQRAHAEAAGNALTRFNAFLAETSRWKTERASQIKFLLDAMIRPGNDVLFQRISTLSALAALPALRAIIADGVTEGTFDTPDIALTAEIIMTLSTGRRSVMAKAVDIATQGDLDSATEILSRRMKAEGEMIDRILGLPPGSIALSKPQEYRQMLRAMMH